jgi:hypothetical protein
MDIAAWLGGLGLEQYAPAFRDNDVDGEVLPELTANDLISIGVISPEAPHRDRCSPLQCAAGCCTDRTRFCGLRRCRAATADGGVCSDRAMTVSVTPPAFRPCAGR